MVFRVYSEKKAEFAHEAGKLLDDARTLLGIKNIESVRIINRYDVENIGEELFEYSKKTVFSEPATDIVTDDFECGAQDTVFAVEYLPGQFDMRADSAAQCIQIISQGERPIVRSARVYVIGGFLTPADTAALKKHVINPVESREASLEKPSTLVMKYDMPTTVETLDGFTALGEDELSDFISKYGLAMDRDDLRFCRDYFISEGRNPTITEIRMIDTYWSDHCRHTTFLTTIDSVKFEDDEIQGAYDRYIATRDALGRTKPQNLMDIATLATKYLKVNGKLPKLDESEEINACTVKIKVNIDGKEEDWLLLFKNETHNHPTEIEPFGGAATCIGGAIRDPLSGRSYVYAAMRVTGAADPTLPLSKTMEGKLPQRTIVTTAAAGYSSYGNQIGLATGIVDEIYDPGYAAKRMEIGAVIAAAPEENVRREVPCPSDVVILLGGRTGRDGCGGATGSSKSHTLESLESCGAEVQKGNAPEERKLQRLFRCPEASKLIKRCNDFGAGGVSVAVGELADGLEINLDAVPKKYDGLDGTELAISESQERMAVVVEAGDVDAFIALASKENLEATVVATVTDTGRMRMTWKGNVIVDLSREFLNSNGAEKHIDIKASKAEDFARDYGEDFASEMKRMASDLNVCSKRGLGERFDSTIGAGTVLMPYGGKYQSTPIQAMVNKISSEKGHTDDCSLMAWGYNPQIAKKSPYHSAYLAVVESVSKLIAAGASFEDVYLTFQEYFEKPTKDPYRWGKPFSALLGAFEAQLDYGIASIGGKDSMSGSFEKLDVPPTLVSFAVTTAKVGDIVSPEFKAAGHRVALLMPEYNEKGIPTPDSQMALYSTVRSLIESRSACAVYTPTYAGVAEGVMKMSFGNGIGFKYDDAVLYDDIFGYRYGAFIVELCDDSEVGITLGYTQEKTQISYKGKSVYIDELLSESEGKLESVYSCNIKQKKCNIHAFSFRATGYHTPKEKFASPRVLIPVFPGTNCEYDSAKAVRDAGATPEIFVIKNLTSSDIAESVKAFSKRVADSQAIFIPGGFSGGDEPDGSGKFITAFFRNGAIADAVNNLMYTRDGMMLGICNGFQALIKLGLVPYGEIVDIKDTDPTLTFNTIGRHQSKIVRTRVASNKSPWLMNTQVGEIYSVPISHGEGRFIANEQQIIKLVENGQIATQYVDLTGIPSYDVAYNPNNSMFAIEGITSPDGRVLGKMGHSERIGDGLYKNVCGDYEMGLFKSLVKYYK